MSKDFGEPPRAAENRAMVEQLLKEAHDADGIKETVTIEWRGQPRHMEVIDVPIDSTYYNPATHRIRAQRSHDPARDAQLEADPWSDDSQDYLQYLLRALPSNPAERDNRYDQLRDNLRDFKQSEPGLITREGVLVNGNTRRAALKELGSSHIRVAVLPASCTWADVSAVELALQLRNDRRRDYSYINYIFALEEQLATGRPIEDVARDFHKRVDTCQRDLWILNLLRDLIKRSEQGGARLRLLDFEDAAGKLQELHRRYIKESASSKDKAEMLKETRLAAIVMDFSKTDVRLIEPDFRRRYVDRLLPEEIKDALRHSASAAGSVKIPGISRPVSSGGPQVTEAKALTDMVLKGKVISVADGQLPSEDDKAAAQRYEELKEVFDRAMEPAGKDARVRKRKQAAPDRLMEACNSIDQCITDIGYARASRSLDEEALDEALLNVRQTLGRLAAEVARTIQMDPGDGAAWLLDAARRGNW
ncbi:transcriptional regulator [Actinomadura sp. NPDC048955]|uniref:transcriptional regulator n=1 Tax=Actinomadura TaxID=1988 RepID=UPI0033E95CBC